jgi:hypothetical protein
MGDGSPTVLLCKLTVGCLQYLVRFQCGDIDGSARTTSVRLNETTECVGNSLLTVQYLTGFQRSLRYWTISRLAKLAAL